MSRPWETLAFFALIGATLLPPGAVSAQEGEEGLAKPIPEAPAPEEAVPQVQEAVEQAQAAVEVGISADFTGPCPSETTIRSSSGSC